MEGIDTIMNYFIENGFKCRKNEQGGFVVDNAPTNAFGDQFIAINFESNPNTLTVRLAAFPDFDFGNMNREQKLLVANKLNSKSVFYIYHLDEDEDMLIKQYKSINYPVNPGEIMADMLNMTAAIDNAANVLKSFR